MQLVITVKDGATNKDIAEQLRWQANLIEGMEPKEASKGGKAKPAAAAKAAAPAAAAEEDDDFKADDGGAEPAGFGDDEAEESFEAAAEEEAEEEAPKKPAAAAKGTKAKSKKITLDDVNDACKAHARAKGRDATLGLLKKKFKTESVTALKPEQYESCISAMAVN